MEDAGVSNSPLNTLLDKGRCDPSGALEELDDDGDVGNQLCSADVAAS
jgi:hypothetical protein